ncbi:hypothetical protein FA10DRAFT_269181 [Acaromyces ingoldii]|uniref:TNFR-Cys domain-containing protein n=1 Tax=Acaromyces ingoldii TaxID=215250 RepID=A0A316YE98_9BASI|nr:hypothetical protein FA10DRAFT_269181 [Acaromyces ingoldii]PWN87900.1 hypothetical protein FA10DRAFT_269181 [Acaromyces ingoldii]
MRLTTMHISLFLLATVLAGSATARCGDMIYKGHKFRKVCCECPDSDHEGETLHAKCYPHSSCDLVESGCEEVFSC